MAASGMRVTRVKWDIARVDAAAQSGGAEGIELATHMVLRATNQVIPYRTGRLAATGDVDWDSKALRGHVYWDTDYAIVLHQKPEWNFRGGKKGLYLKRTMTSSRKKVLDLFGKALKVGFSKR